MLAALNMREAQSKQAKQRYDDVPIYKIGVLVMVKNFGKLEVSDQMGTAKRVVTLGMLLSICNLGVGLNSKQRQRQNTAEFGCQHLLLTPELINTV